MVCSIQGTKTNTTSTIKPLWKRWKELNVVHPTTPLRSSCRNMLIEIGHHALKNGFSFTAGTWTPKEIIQTIALRGCLGASKKLWKGDSHLDPRLRRSSRMFWSFFMRNMKKGRFWHQRRDYESSAKILNLCSERGGFPSNKWARLQAFQHCPDERKKQRALSQGEVVEMVNGTRKSYKTTDKSCNCAFFFSQKLCCKHIVAFRKTSLLPTFSPDLFAPCWKRQSLEEFSPNR